MSHINDIYHSDKIRVWNGSKCVSTHQSNDDWQELAFERRSFHTQFVHWNMDHHNIWLSKACYNMFLYLCTLCILFTKLYSSHSQHEKTDRSCKEYIWDLNSILTCQFSSSILDMGIDNISVQIVCALLVFPLLCLLMQKVHTQIYNAIAGWPIIHVIYLSMSL